MNEIPIHICKLSKKDFRFKIVSMWESAYSRILTYLFRRFTWLEQVPSFSHSDGEWTLHDVHLNLPNGIRGHVQTVTLVLITWPILHISLQNLTINLLNDSTSEILRTSTRQNSTTDNKIEEKDKSYWTKTLESILNHLHIDITNINIQYHFQTQQVYDNDDDNNNNDNNIL